MVLYFYDTAAHYRKENSKKYLQFLKIFAIIIIENEEKMQIKKKEVTNMYYVVQFCDRYDNHSIVGIFSTKEKVVEAVSEIYFQEDEKFDGQFRDYYLADWFSIEVLQIEPDISYF